MHSFQTARNEKFTRLCGVACKASFFFATGDKTAIDRMHTCNWARVTVVSRCFARSPLDSPPRETAVTRATAAVAFNLHPTDKRRG